MDKLETLNTLFGSDVTVRDGRVTGIVARDDVLRALAASKAGL